MLGIWLDICKRHGVTDVLINIHAHANAVREFLQKNSNGTNVSVSEEPMLLGSAGTLAANRKWIASEESFWILYADVLTTVDLTRLLAFHQSRSEIATIGVCEVANPSRCGIVTTDRNDIVQEFIEKPEKPKSNLAFSGIMLARQGVLHKIPNQIPADIGFHVLPRLAGNMAAYRISTYLVDIGTPENYSAAQSTWPGLPPDSQSNYA